MQGLDETNFTVDGDLPARKVDFLCIGAQKGGTTWLNEQLLRHPEVCLPPVKEVHYFNYLYSPPDRAWIVDHYVRPARLYLQAALADPYNIAWPMVAYYANVINKLESGRIDEDWYEYIYSTCDGGKRQRGDITPAYLALPIAGIAAVKEYNPEFRLIALLREPVDRALSAARMMLKRKKITTASDADWHNVLKGHGILAKSRYADQLQRWLQIFGRDQLLVLPFEQIAAEPRLVADQVCDFLGIARVDDADLVTERVHAGTHYAAPDWVLQHLESQLAPERERTGALFPSLTAWWNQKAGNLTRNANS